MTRSVLVLLSVMAGLAGWTVGDAVGSTVRPWFVAVVAAAVVAETCAARDALETAGSVTADSGWRAWRRAEFTVLVLGTKAFHVLTALPDSIEELTRFPHALIDPETGTALAVGLVMWMLANSTLDDLASIERGVETGRGGVARVRSRIVVMSVAVVGFGAFGLVGVDGLLDLDRSASRRVPVTAALFVVASVLALSRLAHRAASGSWERDGAVVDPRVADRWRRVSIAAVLLATVIGIGLPPLTRTISAAPVIGITRTGGLGDWLVDVFERLRDTEGPSVAADGEPGDRVQPDFDPLPPSSRPDWLGEVALWLLVGSVFAFAVVRAGRIRVRAQLPDGDPLPWGAVLKEALRVLGRSLLAVLRVLWDLVRSVSRVVRSGSSRVSSKATAETDGGRVGSLPHDPARARIYEAFRRVSEAAGRVVGARGFAETPREFSRRVAPAPRTAVRTVTSLYEGARYSEHPLGDREATVAERAAERIVVGLEEAAEGATGDRE
jgi:hypothetical protein